MTGGLMQLVAYGSQDLYLTGNPQITFFKAVYRRHTNFSMEYIPQTFFTLPTFSTTQNNIVRAKINRNADLVYDMYLVIDVPSIYSTSDEKFQWVENLGENLIYSCSIDVNGVQLDKLYSQWLNVWSQLNISRSKKRDYNKIIGNTPDMTIPEKYYGNYTLNGRPTVYGRRLYIPLPFWFCRNPGLSIPLIALQYTEIYVTVEFTRFNDLFTMWYGLNPEELYEFGKTNTVTSGIPAVDRTLFQEINDKLVNISATDLINQLEQDGYSPQNYFWKFINGTAFPGVWTQNSYLFVNYIYLDTEERQRFAQVSHEYLITQVQRQQFTGLTGSEVLDMKIQHPVKEMIYVTQRNDINRVNQWNNYSNCLYFKSLFDTSFLKNVFYAKQEIDFIDNNIDTCLPTLLTAITEDPDAFNLNNLNILLNGKLILNGNDRYDLRDNTFYNGLEPYKYHTNSPDEGIYVYSFGVKPEEFQPSGTCNFSRINRAQFECKLRDPLSKEITYNITVYSVNNNIFRIMGGIGNIVFSN